MKKERGKTLDYMYKPKSFNQNKYCNSLNDDNVDIIVVSGPAGTGKTMFACLKAVTLLKTGLKKKIVITRPLVTVEEELGFLPGNIQKKMDPWTRPIFDIFLEYYTKSELDLMVNNNIIEISPLAYMRGRTFSDAFIIADEMQNSSPNQMMMLTTRIGKNSKLVITGDLNQSDKLVNNGLYDFMLKNKMYNEYTKEDEKNKIDVIEFNKNDIERSIIVQKVIDLYNFKKPETVLVKEKAFVKENVKESKEINNNLNINNSTVINVDAALIPKHHNSKYYWGS
jgi:phosphate starvation-inducible PhoH-like protein